MRCYLNWKRNYTSREGLKKECSLIQARGIHYVLGIIAIIKFDFGKLITIVVKQDNEINISPSMFSIQDINLETHHGVHKIDVNAIIEEQYEF